MLPDFEMIQHSFLGGHDITIFPIADVHLGASEQMEQEWMDFIDMVAKTPNVYITLGGDLLNVGTKQSISNVYKERYMPSEAKRLMARMLEPIRDRILCATCGNHERRTVRESDVDMMYDIMAKLDLESLYRENMCFVKIQMGIPEHESGAKTSADKRPTYTLLVTHGNGGGVLTGGAVNRFERYAYVVDGLDVLIAGHVHKPFTTQQSKIYIDSRNNKVSLKPFKTVCATSWLEYSGYAMEKMLYPSSHCLQTLTLSGKRKEVLVTM